MFESGGNISPKFSSRGIPKPRTERNGIPRKFYNFKFLNSFLEFVCTRVGEIRIKSDANKEWFWMPGWLNSQTWERGPPSFQRTPGTIYMYQDGLPWMREPKEPFPMKKEFIAPQLEECRKYMLNTTCAVAVSLGLTYHARATKRGKLWVCVCGHGSVQETHRVQLLGGPGGRHHEKGAVKGVGPLPDKYWEAAGISSFRKPRQDSTRRFLKA
jgi:hypothetical protein